jgi:hypothetical protein
MSNPNLQTDPPAAENDRITHEPGKSFDLIAKLDLMRVAPDGGRVPLIFALASPYMTMDGFWRVPMRVTGYAEPAPEIYAVDSIRALFRALEKIHQIMSLLESQGNKFTDSEGNDVTAADYFKLM